jgi:serine/threonine protein kinase
LQRLEEPIVVVLKNSTTATIPAISNHSHEGEVIEWMATSTSVAIKQMSWDAILSQRGKLAEDPITEVAAMQYLQGFVKSQQEQQRQELRLPTESDPSTKQQQQQHHIMMPLELLSDDEYLYSITPFCTGGRLLDVLENKSRFSEPEARYWMRQILKVSVLVSAHRTCGPIFCDCRPTLLLYIVTTYVTG